MELEFPQVGTYTAELGRDRVEIELTETLKWKPAELCLDLDIVPEQGFNFTQLSAKF